MAETKHAGGAPSKIDAIVRIDGQETTVAQAIIDRLDKGDYLDQAAALAGVRKTAVYDWQRIAARAHIRAHGDLSSIDLTEHEEACIRFSDAVAQATAHAEARAIDTVQLLAAGGIMQEVVTIKVDAEGNEETTTRTSHTLPNDRVLLWWLERRFPDRYGPKLELSGGVELVSTEDRAEALLETARAAQAKRAEPATPRQHRTRKPTKKSAD